MRILIETTVSLTPEQIDTIEQFATSLTQAHYGLEHNATVIKLLDLEAWIEELADFCVPKPPKWVVDYLKEHGVLVQGYLQYRIGNYKLLYSENVLSIFENNA